MASKFYGRLIYSGIYTISASGIDGDMWFFEEQGEDDEI